MKRSVFNRTGVKTRCGAMLVSLALLSWTWPVAAGEKEPLQSVTIAVGYTPGTTSVTPGGTVHIRGFSLVYMMLSDNPLATGRLTVTGDFNSDIFLDGVGSGSGDFEVGTWDLSSGTFTASAAAGRFASRWESKGVLTGENTIKAVGHGTAGEAEGLVYAVEGKTEWDSSLQMYTTTWTGWMLDRKD